MQEFNAVCTLLKKLFVKKKFLKVASYIICFNEFGGKQSEHSTVPVWPDLSKFRQL